ncbi:MAG TPA: guanitoxin biosynthesis heme-dependent pre-guanitoxin N-hydroxylase GntA [Chitinophagaceae bacterium]|nr:guanitoxin biosynthesis heme-dependent pre-guanitoxin N-hydroxylase GntA [Chitinophagaceae bacterium]
MTNLEQLAIIEEYKAHLNNKEFPCIAARASLAAQQIKCLVAQHLACPADDQAILEFLYNFVDEYRLSDDFYHSAAIIFTDPQIDNEKMFDELMWQRLQALANLDAVNHPYDNRVDADPRSEKFSFSIKQEAFYIIGLHPASSRLARRFRYPALVFNPHAQFESLRETEHYEKMKNTVRKRDIAYSGSVNPMLEDFGKASEATQYSGRKYDASWQCPLKIKHAKT